jgi:hypothetical protein
MGAANYRFLPWARRGLSGAIAVPDTGAALAQRAQVRAGLTVSNAGSHGVDLALYGPGDIIGLDPRQIIRTDPRPYSTDAEPAYLATIEFDNPELPWLFTPAAADAQARLRPWLVLVVLETSGPDAVQSPATIRSRPLPFLTLTARQVGRQLPDLSQSWAWAHSQLLVEQGVVTNDVAALGGDPVRNLSRLICPTRLKPMTAYMACLVPAFDLGVLRGIGGTPDPAASLQPAWNPAQPADLILPLYYHWDFATGPDGDFEALARQLKPRRAPANIGTAPMYIWDALPGLHNATAPRQRAVPILMDGALRAAQNDPAELSDIPVAFRDAIAREINAPADIADNSAPDAARAIAAPIYGGTHMARARVPAAGPGWLRELNLDPRARIAAGLGAEVVRAHQEVFMQACWEQVGKVLEANELLNKGRLAAEALARLHTRIQMLPAARQLALAQPLHRRVKLDALTIEAAVERSSLPDASLSPQFRRLTGARRPAVRAAARAKNVGADVALVERMAPGQASVDPNEYTPDGITGLRSLQLLGAVADPAAMIDLAGIGIKAQVPGVQLLAMQTTLRQLAAAPPAAPLALRSNLATIGMITQSHVTAVASVIDAAGTEALAGGVNAGLGSVIAVAETAPRARAFLLEAKNGAAIAGAIDVLNDGRMVVRSPRTQPNRVLGTLGAGIARDGNLAETLAELPVGIFGSATPAAIELDGAGRVEAFDAGADFDNWLGRRFARGIGRGRGRPRKPPPRQPEGFALPVPELERDAGVIDRFASGFARMVEGLQIVARQPQLQLVPFDLASAATATAARINPRLTVPARLATMVQVGGIDLGRLITPGIVVPATVDRIMAAPELPEPAYARLAAFDREAFLPGADAILPDTITLLETNPRFIEAYMIGLNHEMNRELLWRRYPADQRGTPFRHFWDWENGQPDIGNIHAFPPAAPLGHNTRGGAAGGNLVLLVRGALLRRYPNATICAWRAVRSGTRQVLMPNPGPGDIRLPAFFGSFAPDISFAGFDLTRDQIIGGEGWFFVIAQQVTEPRFGFDEAAAGAVAANPSNWLNARWIDTGTQPGQHLDIAGRLNGVSADGVHYGRDAAHLAALAMQRPYRLAVHASHLTLI